CPRERKSLKSRDEDSRLFLSGGLMERFWNKVEITDDCWNWLAGCDSNGYGIFWFQGREEKAHRLSWLFHDRPLAKRKDLHHRCGNPRCVNPRHLKLIQHGSHVGMHNVGRPRQTMCKHGHPLTPENVYVRPGGWNVCRACQRSRIQAYRQRLKEKT